MPIYNAEKYLKESIRSVLSQTFSDLELILVNDGSTDNSLSLCIDYAKSDERIKVINQKNAGVSAARNKGIVYARGEYLTFLDSDDALLPDFLQKAYQSAQYTKAEVSVFGIIMESYRDDILISEEKYSFSLKEGAIYTVDRLFI